MTAAGHPSVRVHRSIAEHLEVLLGTPAWRLLCAGGEGVSETDAFDRALDVAVDLTRLGNADDLHQRGHHVDAVVELRAQLAAILDDFGPRHEHRVARAAEVRG